MMANDYWSKQTPEALLFPDLAWSKPENKRHAGKLLIVGGNAHGFSAPAQAFNEAVKAGIGSARVLLPDAIQKVVKTFIPEAEYGPSTPSGSFASKSLDTWMDCASWADGVLVAGDMGRNSETAIVLEKFLAKHHGPVTATKDAIEYMTSNPAMVVDRPDTLLVLSYSQLQKLAVQAKFPTAFTFDLGLVQLVDALHTFSLNYQLSIITKHLDNILVAVNGQVSTTKLDHDIDIWRVQIASHASVWWLQHPTQAFEALSTAIATSI